MKSFLFSVFFLVFLGCLNPCNSASNLIVAPVVMEVFDEVKDLGIPGQLRISAGAIFPRTIRDDQVKPSQMAVLKTLQKKYPSCQFINIFFSDDKRMYNAGHYTGVLDYRQGKIEITGGAITDQDIKANGGKIWKPTENDIKVASEFYKVNQAAEEKHRGKPGDPISDDEVFKIVSDRLGTNKDSVSRSVKNVYSCYFIAQSK